MVVAVLGDVPYPGQGLIATFFLNFQVTDLNAADREVRNLELDLDWDSGILLPFFGLDRWEAKLSAHVVFLTTGELLDTPDHAILVRHIFDSPNVTFEHRRVDISGD